MYRAEGISWWPEEELSIQELYQCIDTHVMMKPDIMVTHDCPSVASWNMFFLSGILRGKHNKTRTSEAFQAMFELHQPDFHFFGHWHHTMVHTIGRTTFVCLGEMDYVDVDLDNLNQMHEAVTKLRN